MRGCSSFDIAVIQSTGHRVVSWRSRGYVKIPADQNRPAPGKVLKARNNQRRTVGAGHFTAMIKMRVEMEKFLIGLQVEQNHPIRNTGDGGVPALAAGDFRCFRQPESPRVQHGKTVLPVKDRRKLSAVLPVVSAHTDPAILGKQNFQITDLIAQHFLHTDQISFVKPNNTGDSVPTVWPGMLSIRRSVVADIERHDIERRIQLTASRQ